MKRNIKNKRTNEEDRTNETERSGIATPASPLLGKENNWATVMACKTIKIESEHFYRFNVTDSERNCSNFNKACTVYTLDSNII